MTTLPSDAQAALLACLQQHDLDGEQVYTGVHTVRESRGSKAGLFVERTSAEVHPSRKPPSILYRDHDERDILLVYASMAEARIATLGACARRSWIAERGTRQIRTKCVGVCWRGAGDEWDATVTVLDITEDGVIALGLWRQRKLAKPAETLALNGGDRELVALAHRARELGFVLLPDTDDAKRHARQLARTPFARRGWGGGVGTRSLEPTALGAVEVSPETADEPEREA